MQLNPNLHLAREYLAQARHFRERAQALGWHMGFVHTLLKWAANARRSAGKGQMEMFP